MQPDADPRVRSGAFPDDLLTIEECATATRSSYGVIRRATFSGALPSGRAGRRVLVRAEDLLAWVTSGARRTPGPSPEGEQP